jgi:hypothetical protein
VDVGAARVFEPHLDATAILAQAGESTVPSGTWGVFAAEGAGTRLNARAVGDRILLSGSKPWCSLAGILGSAIVTGTTEGQARQAFIVDLRSPGVSVDNPRWTSNGLREIPSGTVHFRDVPATPLGEPGWYFARPGFAWGGMGVAACWLGGAAGLLRDFKAALLKKEPDQIAHAGLGEADRLLSGALEMLSASAARIDDGSLDNNSWPEALRVRGNAVAVVERIQAIVSENLGPGPLAFDRRYAKRMADLSLYVRQHHGMRDDAQLGKLVMEDPTRW